MPKLGLRRKKSLTKLLGSGAPNSKIAAGVPKIVPPTSVTNTMEPGTFGGFQGFSLRDSTDTTALLPPRESPSSSKRSSPDRNAGGSASIDMTPSSCSSTSPLIPKPGTRARMKKDIPRYVPTDWDESLPYGGKVYLARKKKPDTWLCLAIQFFLVLFAVGLVYYAWYHTDHMHFHATKLYAHLGHVQAQAMTAEKYLHGKGVEKNHTEAMAWYKKAAEQGHPHASYNLAVGHLQGLNVGLQPGEAHELIRHAAKEGVIEASDVLDKVCSKGRCDN